MYNWSVDEEKFKKDIQEAVSFLSRNKWVTGGNIYVRKQKAGFFNKSPIAISVKFKKDIPRHEYVSFSFVLDEEIAPTISVIDQDRDKESLERLCLVGRF